METLVPLSSTMLHTLRAPCSRHKLPDPQPKHETLLLCQCEPRRRQGAKYWTWLRTVRVPTGSDAKARQSA